MPPWSWVLAALWSGAIAAEPTDTFEARAAEVAASLDARDVDAATRAATAWVAEAEAARGPSALEVGVALEALAGAYEADKAWSDARAALERAVAIREEALGPDHPDVATALVRLASVTRTLGDLAAARALHLRSLAIRERAFGPDHPTVAVSCNSLGLAYQAVGDYGRARSFFERSLAIREADPETDPVVLGTALTNLSVLLRMQGDYAAAKPLEERNLVIVEEALGPDDPSVARSLNNLALLVRAGGDLAGARPLYTRSLDIYERALGPQHPDVARASSALGGLLKAQGDLAGSLALNERSVAIMEAAYGPEHREVGSALNNLAAVHQSMGNYAEARALFERSSAVQARALGPNHPERAATLNNLAVLYRSLGDHAAAQATLDEALALMEATLGPDHPDLAFVLNSVAAAARARGDEAAAADAFVRAVAIRERAHGPNHPQVAASLGNLGAVRLAQGRRDEARALLERSLAIREQVLGPDHADVALVLNDLAALARAEGRVDDARSFVARGLTIRERALGPDHPDLANSLVLLADLHEASASSDADRAAARPLRDRALTIVEGRLELLDGLSQRESILFLATSRATFDGWLDTFDQPEDHAAAWAAVLRWKGVVTRLSAARQRAAALDPAARPIADALAAVRAERSALTFSAPGGPGADVRAARLAWLGAEQERLERAFAEASAAWATDRERDALGPSAVCAGLPEGARLVDVVRYAPRGEARYVAFVVDPSCDVQRVELGSAAVIDAAASAWRGTLTEPGQAAARVDGRGAEVRELVWDPLAGALSGAHRVVLVPDGALSAIPFSAFPVGGGRYLVERVEIALVADARELVPVAGAPVGAGLLAVGGVDFTGAGLGADAGCIPGPFPALPGTSREAASLEARWAGGRFRREPATSLSGAAATEDEVRAAMSGKRVVHLATHGFYASGTCKSALSDPQGVGYDPRLLSGLVLAGATDWAMTAANVAEVDLRGAELVVLSACASGLGVVEVGEGVQGLRRAFTTAGAQSVVMSLWALPDEATASLMDALYDGVLARRGALDAAAALRAAQRARLDHNREVWGEARPYEWASLVVSGPGY
jgi:CHAT domain-containing protein/tetratricopeptide (TPR) repeat protein